MTYDVGSGDVGVEVQSKASQSHGDAETLWTSTGTTQLRLIQSSWDSVNGQDTSSRILILNNVVKDDSANGIRIRLLMVLWDLVESLVERAEDGKIVLVVRAVQQSNNIFMLIDKLQKLGSVLRGLEHLIGCQVWLSVAVVRIMRRMLWVLWLVWMIVVRIIWVVWTMLWSVWLIWTMWHSIIWRSIMLMVSMVDIDKLVDVLLDAGPISSPWVWDALHCLAGGVDLVESVVEDGGGSVVTVLDLGNDLTLELLESVCVFSALADWKTIDLLDQSLVWDDEGGGETQQWECGEELHSEVMVLLTD